MALSIYDLDLDCIQTPFTNNEKSKLEVKNYAHHPAQLIRFYDWLIVTFIYFDFLFILDVFSVVFPPVLHFYLSISSLMSDVSYNFLERLLALSNKQYVWSSSVL